MRHSLECRVPYLDTELVSFIESLPVEYKVTLSAGKRIHRAAARKVLQPDIVRRKMKGFLSPTRLWFDDTSRLGNIFA
jgi:asparagine synthase (glutamine-hydrolysing)